MRLCVCTISSTTPNILYLRFFHKNNNKKISFKGTSITWRSSNHHPEGKISKIFKVKKNYWRRRKGHTVPINIKMAGKIVYSFSRLRNETSNCLSNWPYRVKKKKNIANVCSVACIGKTAEFLKIKTMGRGQKMAWSWNEARIVPLCNGYKTTIWSFLFCAFFFKKAGFPRYPAAMRIWKINKMSTQLIFGTRFVN